MAHQGQILRGRDHWGKGLRHAARHSIGGALVAAIAIAPATHAADAGTAGAAPAPRGIIQETIVSARRQAENIQEVPLSVTAFTEEDITRVAPRTLRDFDGLAPNVRIGMNTAGPSAGAIFIRGIGYADIEKTQSPAVSVIIDGVQQGSSTGQLIETFDIEQVEILRGPQGVLQGKNTTGGAIVVNRVRPQFNDVDWFGAVQIGSFDERQIRGRVNIPLIDDTLALKVSGSTKERDGYFHNRTLGGNPGAIDSDALSVALRWAPTDAIDVNLTYDYIKDRGDIPPQDPRYNGRDPFENEANIDEFQRYDVDGLTLNVEWELPFGTLTSITGWQQADDAVRQDFDGSTRGSSAVPLVQLHTLREQEYEQFSEELKLSGRFFVDSLEYTVGVFYWKTELDFMQGTNQVLQLPAAAFGLTPAQNCRLDLGEGGILQFGIPNPVLGGAFCQSGAYPGNGSPAYADHRAGEEVTSKAVFGALNWNVTDDIEISAGVRYLDEEKDFHTQFGLRAAPGGQRDELGFPLLPPTDLATVFAGFPVEGNDSWNDTVYRLSANWAISDENRVYASYATGFRSGGFSIRATDPNNLGFEPEDVRQWEIGTKNTFFDGRVRLNLAYFDTVLEGAQFSSILTTFGPPGTNTLILNASEDYTVTGWEIEAIWQVTDEFSIQATAGFQDAQGDGDVHSCLVRPFNPDGTGCNAVTNPGLFPGGVPVANLPDVVTEGSAGFAAADYNWALVFAYNAPVFGNDLSTALIIRATDDVFLSTNNGTPNFEKGYTLVDANVTYTWAQADGSQVVAALTGKNLTDEEYVEQELELGGGGFRGWGPPRQIALELSWRH